MKILRSVNATRNFVRQKRRLGKTIGFVPTMGALHEGHLSLIKRSVKENDVTVLSIFVNPLQFGPTEDFKSYPRQIKKDLQLARKGKVDAVFFPSTAAMYSKNFLSSIKVAKLGERLCGRSRPGHFDGVTTVVGKLFNVVLPDAAYFGEKDAQQVIIIEKFVEDLDFPVRIKRCPTVREPNGLALSSRNQYLSEAQRREAPALYRSLLDARRDALKGTKDAQKIIGKIKTSIANNTSGKIDYVECVELRTLVPVRKLKGNVMIALAVHFGKARLIDNIIFHVS